MVPRKKPRAYFAETFLRIKPSEFTYVLQVLQFRHQHRFVSFLKDCDHDFFFYMKILWFSILFVIKVASLSHLGPNHV